MTYVANKLGEYHEVQEGIDPDAFLETVKTSYPDQEWFLTEVEPVIPPDIVNKNQHDAMIMTRNKMLDDSDWTIIRHKDQVELGLETSLTDEAYKQTLAWRQGLRDMPKAMGVRAYSTSPDSEAGEAAPAPAPMSSWTWPPIPPALKNDFPGYPPDI